MGRLIEEEAVIECLTNTAKYYELEDADEWTKGIHYGLLHGLDNILDNVPTVEAIPKDQYEARLKADMVANYKDIQAEIRRFMYDVNPNSSESDYACNYIIDIIQQKIDKLKGNEDGNK